VHQVGDKNKFNATVLDMEGTYTRNAKLFH
jgi:hypothetical protein